MYGEKGCKKKGERNKETDVWHKKEAILFIEYRRYKVEVMWRRDKIVGIFNMFYTRM